MNVARPALNRAGAIYVHIPFCERLCPYCDFAVAVRDPIPEAEYIEAVRKELDAHAGALEGRSVRTLYFGGGTPSILSGTGLGTLVHASRVLVTHNFSEVTLEANPGSVDVAKAVLWAEAGVNRVSLGVQSFQDGVLKALGRQHTGRQAVQAIEALQDAGISRITIDFIVGGPSHSTDDILKDLDILNGLDRVGHVSAYQMTVEPQTAFGKQHARGRLQVPDEDQTYELLEQMRQGLEHLGFGQYEVSSYARQGQQGQHNQNYWAGGEYLGVGMGAHSFEVTTGYVRRTNTRSLKNYLADPLTPSVTEKLTPIEHLRERLFLGVRSSVGIELSRLKAQFSSLETPIFEEIEGRLRAFENRGWLHFDGHFLPTRSGFMFSDSMAESLYEVG